MTPEFDIAICGAGPVGLALAAMLAQRGAATQRIVLIDARPAAQAATDPRSLAVSYGSRQLLEQTGAWPAAATPIHDIHVSRRGHFGRTLIDCSEYGVPALGYVTRYGALVTTLTQVVERHRIALLRPARIDSMAEHAEGVALHLEDGRVLHAALAVQAEGGLFSEQEAKSVRRDYGQTALIAEVEAGAPVSGRAFERFTDEGPLALLPQDGGYALVWCGRPASAERWLGLTDEAFLAELQAAFGNRLGRFRKVGRRVAYPLGLNARPAATARTVAIGNAAQTLHPVAGQGFNLGLRDAAVLARLLARETTPDMLLQFTQMRQADRSATITLTDAMARVFASAPQGTLSQTMLGWSLGALDCVRPLKRMLAEQMMFGQRQ
jgi:2-octaprenyl-6-methoxyphenol hydroxylase